MNQKIRNIIIYHLYPGVFLIFCWDPLFFTPGHEPQRQPAIWEPGCFTCRSGQKITELARIDCNCKCPHLSRPCHQIIIQVIILGCSVPRIYSSRTASRRPLQMWPRFDLGWFDALPGCVNPEVGSKKTGMFHLDGITPIDTWTQRISWPQSKGKKGLPTFSVWVSNLWRWKITVKNTLQVPGKEALQPPAQVSDGLNPQMFDSKILLPMANIPIFGGWFCGAFMCRLGQLQRNVSRDNGKAD